MKHFFQENKMLGHLTGKKERIWEAYDNHEFWNLTLENPIIQTQETLISDFLVDGLKGIETIMTLVG